MYTKDSVANVTLVIAPRVKMSAEPCYEEATFVVIDPWVKK